MSKQWKRTSGLLMAALALCLLAVGPALAGKPQKPGGGGSAGGGGYTVVDLNADFEASRASCINTAGEVVGREYITVDGTTIQRAVYWPPSDGSAVTPVQLPDSGFSWAGHINDSGEVVGGGYPSAGPFTGCGLYWQPAAMGSYPLDPIDLLPLEGGVESWAVAINDLGIVVGSSFDAQGVSTAVAWRILYVDGQAIGATSPDPLGGDNSTEARDVNNAGLVVGIESGIFGVTWQVSVDEDGNLTTSGPVFLTTPDGSLWRKATAVNQSGDICGEGWTSGGNRCPVLYNGLTGESTWLPVPRKSYASAFALNDAPEISQVQIVGHDTNRYAACIWRDGKVTDLNKLISDRSLELEEAWGINARGKIVGPALGEGGWHAFLLIPK